MAEVKIDISELKKEDSDLIKELSDFLKEKTKKEVETATDDLIIKDEGEAIPRTYLRVLLRKFLHSQGIREYFRVIGGAENALLIREIKLAEEE